MGNVKDKVVIINDDIVGSGGTLVNAANAAKEAGAKYILAICTHAIGSDTEDETFEQRILNSSIDELIVTDTRPYFEEKLRERKELKKMTTIVSIAPFWQKQLKGILMGRQ